ncbi:STAS domain-containing protein [Streptomyces sp. DSM 40750]|uniref:STAS domain-containing protein n=1 Tax=Streptomyces sp. DSM 40750 TaxID=2801030 RepID=UPI00214BBAAF|nr:STAS domain-containing protein [Streptomyces sp. DSM 40750]UUU19345.1 STAS domain-containing protein [Streptomyces sp. DSM 40750]UUU27311.1 STAS domain-containing protein [Streptomyces sp. DSM 40750]
MSSRPFPFALHHRTVDGTMVLELHGEVDLWAQRELFPRVAELLGRPSPDVVVDLRPVIFLDAGGLRLLVQIKDHVALRDGSLRLVRGTPAAWRAVQITRLDHVFTVVNDLPGAAADRSPGRALPT